jgi:hypothetical protein
MAIREEQTIAARPAGIALLIAGASYITLLIILVILSRGHLPQSGRELLDYILHYGLLVQVAMAVFIIKDLCILIAFPILALMLGGMRRPSLWIAAVLASLGMVLDIISSLIVIAFRGVADAAASSASTSETLPTAEFVFHYVWRVETPFMVGLLSLAVLLVSRTMSVPRFGRIVPRLGVILGLLGAIGAAFGMIQPVLLLSVWYIAVGIRLLVLARDRES